LGAAALAAAVLVPWLQSDPSPEQPSAAAGRPGRGPSPSEGAPGELTLASGRALPSPQVASTEAAERLAFSDGSSVTLQPGTDWAPGRNGEGVFESELVRGVAHFRVEPESGRTWVIHAGPTRVRVVGTRFTVRRDDAGTAVEVEQGTVQVRDARLEGGSRRVQAGEHVRLGGGQDPQASPSPAPAESPPRANRRPSRTAGGPAREQGSAATRSAPDPKRPTPQWERLAKEGRHARAYAALRDSEWRKALREAEAERLMRLADVARLSGHPREAVEPLGTLVERYPDHAKAPLAALLLGRLWMDSLDEPSRARRALQRAQQLGVPGALRGDVERRLEELDASGSAR
jgi:transmembrane sensor